MRDEYDFSNAKRAKDVPHLARLQAEAQGKTAVTLLLDNELLTALRLRAESEKLDYPAFINRLLRQAITAPPLDEAALRRILREELAMRW